MNPLTKPKISINEKSFKVTGQIGEGAFAFVYSVSEAKLIGKSDKFAVKKMICQSEEMLEEAMNEVRVLRAINSKFVVSLIDYQAISGKSGAKEVYMLLPLCNGSLQTVIDSGGRKGAPPSSATSHSHAYTSSSSPSSSSSSSVCCIDEDDVIISLLIGAAKGLQAVHNAGFRHADFKPANILLRQPTSDSSSSSSVHSSGISAGSKSTKVVCYPLKGWMPLVTDFGSATSLVTKVDSRQDALRTQDYAATHTTASFRSPELFDTPHPSVINGKADVWSFGCTVYSLLFSKSPFESAIEGLSVLSVLSAKYSIVPTRDYSWSPEILDIVKSCLEVDLSKRIDMEGLISRLEALEGTRLRMELSAADKVLQAKQGNNNNQSKLPNSKSRTASSSTTTTASNVANNNINNNQNGTNNFADFSKCEDEFGSFEGADAANANSSVGDSDGDVFAFTQKVSFSGTELKNNGNTITSKADVGDDFGDFESSDIAKKSFCAPDDFNPSFSGFNASFGDDCNKSVSDEGESFGSFQVSTSSSGNCNSSNNNNSSNSNIKGKVGGGNTMSESTNTSKSERGKGQQHNLLSVIQESIRLFKVSASMNDDKSWRVSGLDSKLCFGEAFVLRPSGLSKRFESKKIMYIFNKSVFIVIKTKSKDKILDSFSSDKTKIYYLVDLKLPFSVFTSDTLAVGSNGLVIDQCASISDISLESLESLAKDIGANPPVGKKLTEEALTLKAQLTRKTRVELSFGSDRDLMNSVIDSLLDPDS